MAEKTPLEEYTDLRDKASDLIFDLRINNGSTLSDFKKILKRNNKHIGSLNALKHDAEGLERIIKEGGLNQNILKSLKEPASANTEELATIAERIKELEKKHPEIRKQWKDNIYKDVEFGREAFYLKKLKKELKKASFSLPIKDIGRAESLSKKYEEVENAIKGVEEAEKNLRKEHGNEEVDFQLLAFRALKDKEDLINLGHLNGEEQEDLEENFEKAKNSGKHLFVWGSTGTGKTTGLIAMFKKRNQNPIIFPCGVETNQFDLFGIGGATTTQEGKKRTLEIGMKPAGVSQAAESGVPLILDEANTLRPEVITELNPILDALSRGEKEAYIPMLGKKIKLKNGFSIVFTGNPVEMEGYLGRSEIDKALSRRSLHFSLPVHSEESFNRVIAALTIHPKTLNFPEDKITNPLLQTAKSIRTIHQIASGEKNNWFGYGSNASTSEPTTLTKGVLTIQDLKTIIRNWASKGFKEKIENEIIPLIKGQNAPKEEKAAMLQIFTAHGLFKDFNHEKVKDLIDEETWKTWTEKKSEPKNE